jgi:predicted alpha/beta hydrolase family esterase
MKRVLVIHGWGNRRQENHWHRRLVKALRERGHAVSYPQLPNTDTPVLGEWLEVIENEISMLNELEGEFIVIGHSLGCLTWLNAVKYGVIKAPVDRVLLVAPADPELCGDAATFQLDLNDLVLMKEVHAASESTLFVGSDSDPWIPRGVVATFSVPLDLPATVVPGASHFAVEEGWGPWQGVINWIDDPAADLAVR